MDKEPTIPNENNSNAASNPQSGAAPVNSGQSGAQPTTPAPSVIQPSGSTGTTAPSNTQETTTVNQQPASSQFAGSDMTAPPQNPSAGEAISPSAPPANEQPPAPAGATASSAPSVSSQSTSPNSTPQPSSQPTSAPAQATHQPPQQEPPASRGSRKKLLSVVAALLLIVSIVGFVFGYYLPNQPENVYSAGLDRTGDTMHEFIVQSTEPEQLEEFSRMQLTGDMNVSSEDFNFEGDVSVQLDDARSNSDLTISMADDASGESLELGLSAITDIAEGERFPDIYFQVRGISELGLDAFMPGVSQLDNQWVEVSAEYLEETIGDAVDDGELDEDFSITLEDYSEFMRVTSENINEYVFTSDEDKAVLQLDEVLGEEEFGDIRTYHYDVSINRGNAHQFCDELVNDLSETSLVKGLSGDDEADLEETKSECRDGVDDFIDETEVELWVDRDTRLIHKVRFTDQDDSGNYVELGQRYQGGDELEIFMNMNSDEDEFESVVTVITNIETNTSTSTLTANQGGANGYELAFTVEMEPYHEEIDVDRPDDTITIEELLEEMFEPQPMRPVQPTDPMIGPHPQYEEMEVEVERSTEAVQQQENAFIRAFSELIQ